MGNTYLKKLYKETNYMKSIETDGFAEKLLMLRKGIRIYT